MPLREGYQALTENDHADFEEEILQYETNTPALGGPLGVMNDQAKALGGRTRYLLSLIQTLSETIATDFYTRAETDTGINNAVALLRAGVATAGNDLAKLYALILQRQTASQVLTAVQNEVNNLVGAAPATLDTLAEIAAFAQDNESEIAALTASIAARLIASNNLSDLPSAATARGNLDVYSQAQTNTQINNAVANRLTTAGGDARYWTRASADARYLQRMIEVVDNSVTTVIGSTSSDGVSNSNVFSFTVNYSQIPSGMQVYFHRFRFSLDISVSGSSWSSGQLPRMSLYANNVLVEQQSTSSVGVFRLTFDLTNRLIARPSGSVTYRFSFAGSLSSGGWSYVRRAGLEFIAEGGKS